MAVQRWLVGVLASIVLAGVAGCGGSVAGSSATGNAVAKSQGCLSCHEGSASPGTGVSVTAEWKASIHFRSNVAGCVDCHEPAAQHPCSSCHGGMSSQEVVKNPDEAKKCFKCHGTSHPEDRMLVNAPQHFYNVSSQAEVTYPASYVSLNYVGKCRKCHNPHDPSTAFAYNVNWAQSGMGDTQANPRRNLDAKTRGNTAGAALSYGQNVFPAGGTPSLPGQQIYCVRCHTTTGYINYVTSDFTNVSPFPTVVDSEAAAADKTKEVTACDACHDDGNGTAYGFKLRKVPPVTVYYNHRNLVAPNSVNITNNAVTFDDAGSSNMCIPCHAGRQNGNVIKLIAAGGFSNFSSLNRVSPHDLAGAASLFRKVGYEFEGLDYTNKSTYKHEDIGMATTGGIPKGPCITCHMNTAVKAESHQFLPVTEVADPTVKSAKGGSIITGLVSKTCVTSGCHVAATPNIPWKTVEELQAKKAGFYAAMQALLEWQAVAKTVTRITRTATPHSPTFTTDWTKINGVRLAPSQGHTFPWADIMGASFNYDALKNDLGAYAHNDVYTKRLIYDSLNWLKQADPTVTTVAQALDNLAAGVYDTRRFATAATTGAQPAQLLSSTFFTPTMATNAKSWLGGGAVRP